MYVSWLYMLRMWMYLCVMPQSTHSDWRWPVRDVHDRENTICCLRHGPLLLLFRLFAYGQPFYGRRGETMMMMIIFDDCADAFVRGNALRYGWTLRYELFVLRFYHSIPARAYAVIESFIRETICPNCENECMHRLLNVYCLYSFGFGFGIFSFVEFFFSS